MTRYLPLLFLFLSVFSCKQDNESLASVEDKIDKKTLVELDSIQQRTNAIPINAIGRIGSDKELRLSFKIGGIVSSIKVDEGQRIRKGQVLASLRTNEIDAQVMKAKQSLSKAQRDLERIKKMYDEDAATLENVQDLSTLVEVSKADLDIAQFNQKYAVITSPVNGRVLNKVAEANELVSPGQPIFRIAPTGTKAFVMKVALSDKDITRVNYGDQASATFDAFPGEHFEGAISLIAESADPRTGTFEVEITLSDRGKRLRNGYIGKLEIRPKTDQPFYTIPMAALVEANDEAVTIFIPVNNNTIAREIKVKPLHITTGYIAIEDPGINNFSTVITTGAPYLLDGDSIRLKN